MMLPGRPRRHKHGERRLKDPGHVDGQKVPGLKCGSFEAPQSGTDVRCGRAERRRDGDVAGDSEVAPHTLATWADRQPGVRIKPYARAAPVQA